MNSPLATRIRWAAPVTALMVAMSPVVALPAVQANPSVPVSQVTAAKSVRGAAYQLMKQFMTKKGYAFSKVISLGDPEKYRDALAGVNLVVDPKISSVAVYDPKTKTITFSRDPRTIPPDEMDDVGNTVWHEVTHAIEDANGGFGPLDNDDYAEHNIDYMTQVARGCRIALERFEDRARAGASAKELRNAWKQFLTEYVRAFDMPSVKQYPPDMAELRKWFGFTMEPAALKAFYKSGKFLPGPKGANVRKAAKKAKLPVIPAPEAPTPTPTPTVTPTPAPTEDNSDCIFDNCSGGIPSTE